MRWAAKKDAVERDIIDGLKRAGVGVWQIGFPVDLLCRYWSNRHRDFIWMPVEVKTPYGKRQPKARVDSRQEAQKRFLAETGVPVVASFSEALQALGIEAQTA